MSTRERCGWCGWLLLDTPDPTLYQCPNVQCGQVSLCFDPVQLSLLSHGSINDPPEALTADDGWG